MDARHVKLEVLMKKRILCLLLGLVMILSAMSFVGCAGEEEEEADVAKNTGAKTITLRIISEKYVCNTDEELAAYLKNECGNDKTSQKYKDMLDTMKAYETVESEISKVTKSNYKTNVDILFYTEENYYDLMETAMAEYALEQKNAENAQRALEYYMEEYKEYDPEAPESAIKKAFYKYFPEYEKYKDFDAEGGTSAGDDVYVENDLGIKELVYPEAEENQLDIVYLSGYDMYTKYIENEWIVGLNSYISTTGKQLTYNISPTLLNGVKYDGETYAVPNNVQIGEYTYMLVDKTLATKYKYTYDSFENLIDCRYFIDDVATNEKVLPIDASFKECMDLYTWYWNIGIEVDPDLGVSTYTINPNNEFFVLGTHYKDPASIGRGFIDLGFNNLFTDPEYREMYLTLKEYEFNGCYKSANDKRGDAAVSFVNGNYAMLREANENNGVYTDENGSEYFLYVAKYPKADEKSLYGNMFAISANSKQTQACMEVINLINTNSKVRNLLQYGIKQGEHLDGQIPNYAIDEETGVLKRLNNLYMMDIEKTGNCFIAYPEEGLAPDYWEDSKAQNNDALIDPLLGFDFNERLAEYGSSLDDDLIENCVLLTEQILKQINSCSTYAELESVINGSLADDLASGAPMLTDKNIPVNLDKMTNKNYDTSNGLDGEADPAGESPYALYYKWLTAYSYAPAN